jgi:glutamate racemase
VSNQKAVGVFDSGLGGLTVVRAIRAHLPSENVVFLGDTARVPYGTRSPETVVRYARSCARILSEFDMKLLVVACNTVSAVALEMLRTELGLPVLGVIEPGARTGASQSRSGCIGVIATPGTVASGAYERAVAAAAPSARVVTGAAPLLVPLAEEGWTVGEVPELVVQRYLAPLVRASIDVLVLGCTHYPLLKEVIEVQLEELSGHAVPVVDSAEATACALEETLLREGSASDGANPGYLELFVTDMPGKFAELASRFLGEALDLEDVRQIDL